MLQIERAHACVSTDLEETHRTCPGSEGPVSSIKLDSESRCPLEATATVIYAQGL